MKKNKKKTKKKTKLFQCSLNLSFRGQKNPQKYKNPNKIIPCKVWDFSEMLHTLLDINIV